MKTERFMKGSSFG
jgi:hypothetical protein